MSAEIWQTQLYGSVLCAWSERVQHALGAARRGDEAACVRLCEGRAKAAQALWERARVASDAEISAGWEVVRANVATLERLEKYLGIA